MRTRELVPKRVEFSTARPKNRLVVENQGACVVIQAARDNFSPREKSFFVRYLAAEGYIPLGYQKFAGPLTVSSLRLTWTVDRSCQRPLEAHRDEAFREALCLVLGSALFWLLLILLAFRHVL